MKRADVWKYAPGTAEHVVLHARWKRSRGRNPSLSFCGITNPTKALALATRFAYFPESGRYLNGTIPAHYVCADCGATRCKLWREYNTFLENQVLRCAPCAAKNQGKDVSDIDGDGRFSLDPELFGPDQRSDQIGWLVPAVPTEEGDTYWGYTSVPQPGCDWWRSLPTFPTHERVLETV